MINFKNAGVRPSKPQINHLQYEALFTDPQGCWDALATLDEIELYARTPEQIARGDVYSSGINTHGCLLVRQSNWPVTTYKVMNPRGDLEDLPQWACIQKFIETDYVEIEETV